MTEKDKNIQCRKRQKREVKDYIPSEDWNQEAKIKKKKCFADMFLWLSILVAPKDSKLTWQVRTTPPFKGVFKWSIPEEKQNPLFHSSLISH